LWGYSRHCEEESAATAICGLKFDFHFPHRTKSGALPLLFCLDGCTGPDAPGKPGR
jgi:hypothetical protein